MECSCLQFLYDKMYDSLMIIICHCLPVCNRWALKVECFCELFLLSDCVLCPLPLKNHTVQLCGWWCSSCVSLLWPSQSSYLNTAVQLDTTAAWSLLKVSLASLLLLNLNRLTDSDQHKQPLGCKSISVPSLFFPLQTKLHLPFVCTWNRAKH